MSYDRPKDGLTGFKPNELEQAFQRAGGGIEQQRLAYVSATINGFISVYGSDRVSRDEERARAKQAQRRTTDTPDMRREYAVATVLEFHVLNLGKSEYGSLFGKKAKVFPPYLHDDMHNAVDVLVEWEESQNTSSLAALRVDVTHGMRSATSKLEATKRRIETSKNSSVEYFSDYGRNFFGTMNNVPVFTIGCGEVTIKEIDALLQSKNIANQVKYKTHPLRALLLTQILSQATFFEKFARKCGNEKLAAAYASIKNRIAPLRSKLSLDNKSAQDPVHIALKDWLEVETKNLGI